MAPDPGEITVLLSQLRNGSPEAASRLMSFVYDELRRLPAGYIGREPPGVTLQPTALVHEAYLRLLRDNDLDWRSRAHFLGVAANVMRRVLIEHARARRAEKRGGSRRKVELHDGLHALVDAQSAELLDLDRALDRL